MWVLFGYHALGLLLLNLCSWTPLTMSGFKLPMGGFMLAIPGDAM